MERRPSTQQARVLTPRRIACTRCRTRKKRCDHAVPVCGECKKSGSQCVQYGARTSGSFATVPITYLRQLEVRLAEFQGTSSADNVEATDVPRFSDDAEGANEENDYPSPFTSNAEAEAGQPLPPAADNMTGFESTAAVAPGGAADHVQRKDRPLSQTEMGPSNGPSPASHSRHVGFDVDVVQSSTTDLASQPPQQREEMGTPWPEDEVNSPEAQGARLFIGEDWMDHYASIYFHHIQPQWSFLDESAWMDVYVAWKGNPSGPEPSHRFIIQLVLAVGALMSSSFRVDCPHLLHAFRAHDGAVRCHLGQITQHPSALIRTQASLLLILYAFHSPSSASIPSDLLLVLMNCTNLMNQKEGSDPAAKDLGQRFDRVRRQAIMSSTIVNELVSSAWTYPQTFMFGFLDDSVFRYTSEMTVESNPSGFFEHLFQLRCIQSRIRHYNKKLQKLDPTDPFRERCRVRLKDELRVWKDNIQGLINSSPRDDFVYHEPGSLSKLYDYSLSILMQERPCTMGIEDVSQLVESCSEACRTFRLSQENDTKLYRTWSALMYQFRLGVTLLYCYAMTPAVLRTPVFSLAETLAGLESCQATLNKFSALWPRSLVFLRVYQLLAESTFDGAAFGQPCDGTILSSPSSQPLCSSFALEGKRKLQMQDYIVELKMHNVHQAVIVLIEEMVYKPQPADMEYNGIDFMPNMALAGLDLFNL